MGERRGERQLNEVNTAARVQRTAIIPHLAIIIAGIKVSDKGCLINQTFKPWSGTLCVTISISTSL